MANFSGAKVFPRSFFSLVNRPIAAWMIWGPAKTFSQVDLESQGDPYRPFFPDAFIFPRWVAWVARVGDEVMGFIFICQTSRGRRVGAPGVPARSPCKVIPRGSDPMGPLSAVYSPRRVPCAALLAMSVRVGGEVMCFICICQTSRGGLLGAPGVPASSPCHVIRKGSDSRETLIRRLSPARAMHPMRVPYKRSRQADCKIALL